MRLDMGKRSHDLLDRRVAQADDPKHMQEVFAHLERLAL